MAMTELNETQKSARTENQFFLPTESFRVSQKLILTAIPLEHIDLFLSTHPTRPDSQKQMASVLFQVDGLITEYFPFEIEKIGTGPIGPIIREKSNYDSIMIAFPPLIEEMKKFPDKKIYVFDPAHDENFLYITLASGIVGITGALLSAYPIEKVSIIVEKMRNQAGKLPQQISRRDFLKIAASIVASTSMMSFSAVSSLSFGNEYVDKKPSDFPITEAHFRRIVTAKHIFSLADFLDSDSKKQALNLALVYPKAHWEGIKYLLGNRPKTETQFSWWSTLKLLPTLDKSFFTGRIYQNQEGQYNLIKEVKV